MQSLFVSLNLLRLGESGSGDFSNGLTDFKRVSEGRRKLDECRLASEEGKKADSDPVWKFFQPPKIFGVCHCGTVKELALHLPQRRYITTDVGGLPEPAARIDFTAIRVLF